MYVNTLFIYKSLITNAIEFLDCYIFLLYHLIGITFHTGFFKFEAYYQFIHMLTPSNICIMKNFNNYP